MIFVFHLFTRYLCHLFITYRIYFTHKLLFLDYVSFCKFVLTVVIWEQRTNWVWQSWKRETYRRSEPLQLISLFAVYTCFADFISNRTKKEVPNADIRQEIENRLKLVEGIFIKIAEFNERWDSGKRRIRVCFL